MEQNNTEIHIEDMYVDMHTCFQALNLLWI